MGYASRTGTRRNLAALRAAGWRLIISPTGVWRDEGFRYGLDNGAWTAFQQGTQWDEALFLRCAEKFGAGADWIVVPDIVGGGAESLALSVSWLPRLRRFGVPLLIAVQDGMMPADVEPYLDAQTGIFVGGTTEWKLASMPGWGDIKRRTGCYLHVGRVNSIKRIYLCGDIGADSFDGTSASRYAVTTRKLDMARRQTNMGDL